MTDFQTIKYRLIGAAIIVCSLVLSWWLFLDHDLRRYQDVSQTALEPLVIERFDIEKPVPPPVVTETVARRASTPEPESEPAPPAGPPATTASAAGSTAQPQRPYSALDETNLPEAWVVQVASFQQQDNARQLQGKLLKAGMPAYVKVFHLQDGPSYRVLIGPRLNRERAEQLLQKVSSDFALQGMLVRYKPGYEQ